MLTPLLPLLIEIAQLRKQAMERLYKAFCVVREKAQAGQIALPYRFQYTDRCITLTDDAPTIGQQPLGDRATDPIGGARHNGDPHIQLTFDWCTRAIPPTTDLIRTFNHQAAQAPRGHSHRDGVRAALGHRVIQ